jgi:hypothetical protein
MDHGVERYAVETVMRITNLFRLFSRLLMLPQAASHVSNAGGSAPLLDFDPFWHGDHWQNLLASPMDARHYVMEDWAALPASDKVDTAKSARPKGRRDPRRRI